MSSLIDDNPSDSSSPVPGGSRFMTAHEVLERYDIPVLIVLQDERQELVDYRYVDSNFALAVIYSIDQRRALQNGNA